jgi:hypothetical protein
MRWILLLAACTTPPPKCPGAQPSRTLYEDYCQNGEAARCYLLSPPTDDF